MSLLNIVQQAPAIWGGIGTAGGLAGAIPLSKWWEHRRASREQTDEVALALVTKLERRIETLETEARHEREHCEQKLTVLRHELRNVETSFDSLLLTLKYASPDRVSEIVADVLERRQRKQAPPVQKVEVTVAPTP